MRGRRRGGFTLVEMLVAVTISTVVVMLVATLFIIQNRYYRWMLDRVRIQDAARSAVELVGLEVRSVPAGAITVADSTRLAFRQPMALGVVCGFAGSDHAVYLPDGLEAIDQDEVAGFGLREADGSWSFYGASWGSLYTGSGSAACAGAGADTLGASSSYLRFGDLASASGVGTAVGTVVTIYRLRELAFSPSSLDPLSVALYRGISGGSMAEFATGLTEDAHFRYRLGDTTHVAEVTGAQIAQIDGVRVVASTRGEPTAATRGPSEYELVGGFLLPNAN